MCFDVNEDGLIAIGTSDFSQKSVSIYNLSGAYIKIKSVFLMKFNS